MDTRLDLGDDDRYRAVVSRDARFDGRFIVGVISTGIYCRPSCPAPVRPKRTNVRFFRTASAAQRAGLRACKRCAPDASPGTPEWDVRADLVGRAMRLITDGAVDREGVAGLARRLAVSERHLHRVLADELGATPIQLARSQRARTAQVLIETTDQPFSAVAFAAGFTSIRQFNDTIREVFADTPTGLRAASRRRRRAAVPGTVAVRLSHRTPLDAAALLAWSRARAVAGVEEVDERTIRRSLRLPRGNGTVTLEPRDGYVLASFRLDALGDLPAAVARCRRLLDLDADPTAVAAVLAGDPALRALLAAHRGLRVPGTVDGFELAVRAVVGQQVSVAGARTLLGRLAARCGTALEHADGPVSLAFPSAADVAGADLAGLGLTAARERTLRALAEAVTDGELELEGATDRGEVRRRLAALPGIGPWTVEYVALRALRDPDALPATDLVLRRRAAGLGLGDTPAELARRAEAWRPWRAYAAQLLWTADTSDTDAPDTPDEEARP